MLRSWQNPFSESDSLINIASGMVASSEVERDCIRALEIGEAA